MGLNLSVNILTSGFLVSVTVFFALMGYFFAMAYSKMGQVLERGDSKRNNLEKLDSALKDIRVAYILAFIAAGLSLLLAILYAGHETIISPSEYWHLALFLITYTLLVISVIYAFIALNKLYDLSIEDRNGADSYIWAGLFVGLFGFMGLTASSSGRLGMNIARSGAKKRLNAVESKVNEHLPAIRGHVENVRQSVEHDIPVIKSKVDQLHAATLGTYQPTSSPVPSVITTTVSTPSMPGALSPTPLASQPLPSFTTTSQKCPDAGSPLPTIRRV